MSVSKTPHRHGAASARLRKLARSRSLVRTREVAELGIHTGELTRLTRAGELVRIGPGRYQRPGNQTASEYHDLAMATSAVRGSVICLLSALRFHGIGTQLPHQVWLGIPRGTRVPRLTAPPLRVVNVSRALINVGAEEHFVEGRRVRVYTVARTVADCFRFRNSVGMDVALEALAEAWRAKRLDLEELNGVATQLRVQRVMQPYLEAIVL